MAGSLDDARSVIGLGRRAGRQPRVCTRPLTTVAIAANMAALFTRADPVHLSGDPTLLRTTSRFFALMCLAALLSACGWRLQGTSKLSEALAVTYVDTDDRYTDFNRALRDSLRASGARLTERREDATAVVRIIKDESGQRVLSVSARNTPEEYEVFYTVEYSVAGRTAELIEPQKLELTRDYSYDETAVLAKQREHAILREALARDLAGLVVRRLASL